MGADSLYIKAMIWSLFGVFTIVGVVFLALGISSREAPFWPAIVCGAIFMAASFGAFRIAENPTWAKLVILFLPALGLGGLILLLTTLPL